MGWLLALVPGVGPALSTGFAILSNRFAQIALAALFAFIWGHHVADKSAALREAARERAVLAAKLQEAERQAKASADIAEATAKDLRDVEARDRENQERIKEYERSPPSVASGPCTLDDDFRRRLRAINSGR